MIHDKQPLFLCSPCFCKCSVPMSWGNVACDYSKLDNTWILCWTTLIIRLIGQHHKTPARTTTKTTTIIVTIIVRLIVIITMIIRLITIINNNQQQSTILHKLRLPTLSLQSFSSARLDPVHGTTRDFKQKAFKPDEMPQSSHPMHVTLLYDNISNVSSTWMLQIYIYCMIYKCRNVSCFSAHIKPLRILFSVFANTHAIMNNNMYIYLQHPVVQIFAFVWKSKIFGCYGEKTPLQRKNVVKKQPEKSVRQKTPFDRQKTPFGWQKTPFQL